MHTTLNKIREQKALFAGWEKLLRTLGKNKADDEPLSLITILDSNGLDDALWCLRAVDGYDREMRLLAVKYARQVQHLMTDQKSLDALDVSERFANGQATQKELEAALGAARSAWEIAASVAASVATSVAASVATSVAASATARAAQEVMFREMFGENNAI